MTTPTRTGYVTLVGRPNAGKSTLMNALVGADLSIVTPRAQTTWERVTGLVTRGNTQLILLDTPGLLQPRDLLQKSMLASALLAVNEADVLLVVLDAARPTTAQHRTRLLEALEPASAPRLVAVNKVDAASDEGIQEALRFAREELGGAAFPVSAVEGTGLDPLRTALEGALPEGPFLFPAEDLASQPVRFFAAELVRETVFEQFREEIPWSVMTRVEEFREGQEPVYIGISVFVERASQKGILVGSGGSAIKALGREARRKIEHFTGRRVYLDLWVKVLPKWRRKRARLRRLGFHLPDETDGAS
jgi:GTP-binding protein Era